MLFSYIMLIRISCKLLQIRTGWLWRWNIKW